MTCLIFDHQSCTISQQVATGCWFFAQGRAMTRQDIEAWLVDQLAAKRGKDRDEVHAELTQDPAIDSLEVLELVVPAEQEFGIAVSDDELSSCRSLPDLTRVVRSKLAGDRRG
jgi:acyl carrier protein